MNFAFAAGPVPGMGESSFSGGDPGLNYRFLNIPESNENNYSSKDRMPSPPSMNTSEEADFSLFPCREECKQKLGGKGFGFRDCVRECKGKGARKSVLKTRDLALQEKAVTSLSDSGSESSREMAQEEGSSKKTMWIIVGSIILVGIGIGIYFLTRKKAEATT